MSESKWNKWDVYEELYPGVSKAKLLNPEPKTLTEALLKLNLIEEYHESETEKENSGVGRPARVDEAV